MKSPDPKTQMKKEIDEEEYLYEIVERMSRETRREFAIEFSDDLKGIISEAALSKARRGIMHLKNETILEVISINPKAKRWILKKAKEDIERIQKMIEELENLDDDEFDDE
jgi:transcriptional/translational regulatory protein YebC/TACO1